MSIDEHMTLQVTIQQIEQYCDELCRGSANISRKHSALIALEGFIVRHASTDKYTAVFNRIIDTIQRYAEQTRNELLKEYAAQLKPALLDPDCQELARIHQSVSRNGFDQLLDQVLSELEPDQLAALKRWSTHWLAEAELKASRASGYPDALNFNGAGIVLAEYRAISELKRKLAPL